MIHIQKKSSFTPSAPWWLSPSGLAIGFLLPVYFAIIFVGSIDTDSIRVKGMVFLQGWHLALGAALIAVIAIGSKVGEQVQLSDHGKISERNWTPFVWAYGLIVLFAYTFWFKDIIFSPSALVGVITGGKKFSRNDLSAVAGVTSLVNFLPVYFAVISYLLATEPKKVPSSLKALSVILFLFTIFRVYVWAERLALIELFVASFLPFLIEMHRRSANTIIKTLLKLGPIVGIPALIAYFGGAEYFRSWQSDLYNNKTSFWSFAVGRLGSYYYTSLNNGAGLLELYDWPTYKFEHTLQFAHKAPALIGPIFRYYTGTNHSTLDEFLNLYADPEFNNPSGLYTTVFDMGIAGAFYYYAIMGFLAGVLYRSFLGGGARGVIFYPLFFIMMLEIYRYPYLGSSRSFTSVLGGLVALWVLGLKRKQINKKAELSKLTATTVRLAKK